MIVLGLDPATSCGWAIDDFGELGGAGINSGVWNLKPRRGESPGMRYIRLLSKLHEILKAYQRIDLVAYEQAHQRGGAATEYAIGYSTHIQAFCAQQDIQHVAIHTSSLKKFATGSGRASKAEMVQEAERRYGLTTTGKAREDEADALMVMMFARVRYGTIQGGESDAQSDRQGQRQERRGSGDGTEEGNATESAAGPVRGNGPEEEQEDRGRSRDATRGPGRAHDLGQPGKRAPRKAPRATH